MLRSVFTKFLRDHRRSVVGWSITVAAVGVLYASFYPSMNNPDMAAALEAFPQGLIEALGMADIVSPAGYLGSTTYGILGPVLMIIYAGMLGVRAIAGDEEDGRLDVLLAHPVARSSLVLQRAAALCVAVMAAGLVLFAAMVVVSGPAQFEDLGASNLAAATIQLVLLGLVFGALALAAGGVTGRPAITTAVVGSVAVLSYVANSLGRAVDGLGWARDLSAFRYYSDGEPLRNGLQVGDSLVLAVGAIVLVIVARVGVRRRDVAV